MIKNGKLIIYRKTQSQWLIMLVLSLTFFVSCLIDFLKFPSLVRYGMDVCWCLLLVLLVLNRSRIKKISGIHWWSMAFAGYGIISYLFQFQSPFYLLWGVRNNFRFYVFFAAVACFLKWEEKERYIKYLDILFWCNAVIALVQYFAFDYKGDYLGGLFGVQKGGNGYLNILLVIYLAKTILWYLNRKETMASILAKVAVCMLLAALAELKFFFVEAIIIAVAAALVTRISIKKVLMVVFAGLLLLAGVEILGEIFPSSASFFQWENLLELITSETYATGNDLGRFTAVSTISNTIMDSPWQRLIGFGLGNCDTAEYAFLQTPFYLKYEYLHYVWFSSAFIFIEMGWIGLTFFFGFFALVFVRVNRLRKQGGDNQPYCQLAMIVAVMCAAIAVYNSSLRTEAGYMAYLVMALPFVQKRDSDVLKAV